MLVSKPHFWEGHAPRKEMKSWDSRFRPARDQDSKVQRRKMRAVLFLLEQKGSWSKQHEKKGSLTLQSPVSSSQRQDQHQNTVLEWLQWAPLPRMTFLFLLATAPPAASPSTLAHPHDSQAHTPRLRGCTPCSLDCCLGPWKQR